MIELAAGAGLGAAVALLLGWLLWARPLAAALAAAEAERGRADALQKDAVGLTGENERAKAVVDGLRMQLDEAKAGAARVAGLQADVARLTATQAERDAAHAAAMTGLREEFARVAGEALATAQAGFAAQAAETLAAHREAAAANLDTNKSALSELLNPVSETLKLYRTQLEHIESERKTAYGGLHEALAGVAQGQQAVREEAAKLSTALRSSGKTAGRWGEEQLQRTLELGGLRLGVDFRLQTSQADEEGRQKRPDAIISLPGDRELVIDSKCSVQDYLNAVGCDGDERRALLARHAAAFKTHVRGLVDRAYWNEFGKSADFVIMFVPGENFLSAALEADMELMTWAMERRVILTGPANLLALARVVSMTWRQEKLAEEAKNIGDAAAQLYAGLSVMGEHVEKLRRNLGLSVDAFNDFVGSMERNVLPKARRLPELGVDRGKKPLVDAMAAIEVSPRTPVQRELLPAPDPLGLGSRALAAE